MFSHMQPNIIKNKKCYCRIFGHVHLNILKIRNCFSFRNVQPRRAEHSNKRNFFFFGMFGHMQPNILIKENCSFWTVWPRAAVYSNENKNIILCSKTFNEKNFFLRKSDVFLFRLFVHVSLTISQKKIFFQKICSSAA